MCVGWAGNGEDYERESLCLWNHIMKNKNFKKRTSTFMFMLDNFQTITSEY